MPSAAAISGPIITTSPPRPAGRTSRSSSSPSWARAIAHLPAGERGEIAIRSAANIRGYWRDEAATRAAFTADGYLRTGDIGYLDEDDYLFIVDRKKDIIIRGGENISAQEVEAAIYAHPAVSEAAVFGIADERLGEVPAAVVYCEEGGLDAGGAAAPSSPGGSPSSSCPPRSGSSDEPLPKLGTGKIDKVSLCAPLSRQAAQRRRLSRRRETARRIEMKHARRQRRARPRPRRLRRHRAVRPTGRAADPRSPIPAATG